MDAEHTILAAKESILDSSSLTVVAGVKSCFSSACLSREGPDGTESSHATEPHLAGFCGLHSEGLSHDGAATSNGLQIGHAATTWRLAGRGGEGAKRGRRGLLQEWAHGLRLAKYSVHGGRIGDRSAVFWGCVVVDMYRDFFFSWVLTKEKSDVGGGSFMSSTSEVWLMGTPGSGSFAGGPSALRNNPLHFQWDTAHWPIARSNAPTMPDPGDASYILGLGHWWLLDASLLCLFLS